jgi:hypothetical protein
LSIHLLSIEPLSVDVFDGGKVQSLAMRARRILVILAALLALAAGPATATTRVSAFSTASACVLLLSERTQPDRKVVPARVPAPAELPSLAPLPEFLCRGAWADAAVRFQRPPPAVR